MSKWSNILILCLILGVLMPNVFPVRADNNYFDVLKFYLKKELYKEHYYPLMLDFYVKTTFTELCQRDSNGCWCVFNGQTGGGSKVLGSAYLHDTINNFAGCANCYYRMWIPYGSGYPATCPAELGGSHTYTFSAGNTYSVYISGLYYIPFNFEAKYFYFVKDDQVNQPTGIKMPNGFNDTEIYPYTEEPSLIITYPHDNDEIAGAFNIEGSYTIPASSTYDTLTANFAVELDNGELLVYRYSQSLATTTGAVDIRVAGILQDTYQLYFYFKDSSNPSVDYSVPDYHYTIKIANFIPPELPTGEMPPNIPVFDYVSCSDYYLANSDYATASAMFVNLCNAVSPLIDNLGNNLVSFADNFSSGEATANASTTANAIVLARGYVSNLNSFFNNLPVAQALGVYIIMFLAVALFRLARSIISLFKL